ncbi:hypothetical protein BJ508DRAFT_32435 [Ascobolus immersus RN42]|uniref:Uncharacterized protein n=1 Tax=Ascobolus immersus RN42 TaxID=1160509 RepID=A0A3N4IEN1_ASCIM|nr:hypothetical protein BJ508DRAFT_32435 [Ascobolus immersus RN42]
MRNIGSLREHKINKTRRSMRHEANILQNGQEVQLLENYRKATYLQKRSKRTHVLYHVQTNQNDRVIKMNSYRKPQQETVQEDIPTKESQRRQDRTEKKKGKNKTRDFSFLRESSKHRQYYLVQQKAEKTYCALNHKTREAL